MNWSIGFVAFQGLCGPVGGDRPEETVFDGIPFGGSGWVMAEAHLHAEGIAETCLELVFPEPGTIAVAAAPVGEDEDFIGLRICSPSDMCPPPAQRVDGEFGGVLADAEGDEPFVANQVVDPVGNAYALGGGGEVVVEHLRWRSELHRWPLWWNRPMSSRLLVSMLITGSPWVW